MDFRGIWTGPDGIILVLFHVSLSSDRVPAHPAWASEKSRHTKNSLSVHANSSKWFNVGGADGNADLNDPGS